MARRRVAVRNCRTCDVPMVSERQWNNGVRPEGHRFHKARGLCTKCLHAEQAAERGATVTVWRSRADVVAAWIEHQGQGLTQAESAALQGMTVSALASHVSRARRLGFPVPSAGPTDEDILEDWAHIRWGSGSFGDMAARLGVSTVRLRETLEAAQAAGDDRGMVPAWYGVAVAA